MIALILNLLIDLILELKYRVVLYFLPIGEHYDGTVGTIVSWLSCYSASSIVMSLPLSMSTNRTTLLYLIVAPDGEIVGAHIRSGTLIYHFSIRR